MVDETVRDITLNTKTAMDGMGERMEKRLGEVKVPYEPEFEAWDGFVSDVLRWLGGA